MEVLHEYRSRAMERIERREDVAAAFPEYAETSRQLRQDDLTANLLRSLHENDRKVHWTAL